MSNAEQQLLIIDSISFNPFVENFSMIALNEHHILQKQRTIASFH
jgi:hypothetical protein